MRRDNSRYVDIDWLHKKLGNYLGLICGLVFTVFVLFSIIVFLLIGYLKVLEEYYSITENIIQLGNENVNLQNALEYSQSYTRELEKMLQE